MCRGVTRISSNYSLLDPRFWRVIAIETAIDFGLPALTTESCYIKQTSFPLPEHTCLRSTLIVTLGHQSQVVLVYRLRAFIMPLNAKAIYPASDPEFISFPSRRSVVHSTNGIVACTQPLAAQAGQRILREGGNAAVSGTPPTSNQLIHR